MPQNLPLILASVFALLVFLLTMAALAWYFVRSDGRDPGGRDRGSLEQTETPVRQPAVGTGAATGASNRELVEQFRLLEPLSNQVTETGEKIELSLVASDPSRQESLLLELEASPATATIVGNRLTWVPGAEDAGRIHAITVRATDAGRPGPPQRLSFNVEVLPASVVAPGPIEAEEGKPINVIADLGLGKRDAITYRLTGDVPDGLSIEEGTGRLNWTPHEAQSPSSVHVGVQAHNATGGLIAETELNIRVAERNRILKPVLPVAQAGDTMLVQLHVDEPRKSDRYFFVKGRVKGMFLDPDSGQLRWRPLVQQAPAAYKVTVGLADRMTPEDDPRLYDHRELTIKVKLNDRAKSMDVPFFPGASAKQRVGHLQVGGELLRSILISGTANDFSDPKDLRLVVDLDGDGVLHMHDGSAEVFAVSQLMNLNGEVFQATRPDAEGKSLRLQRSSRKAERKRYLVDGYPAPSFRARTASGRMLDLKAECARSKLVLVEFWADWCAPCRRMYDDLAKIHRDYRIKGLTVVGINRDHDLNRARKAIAENGLSYDHIFDNVEKSPGIGKQYRAKAIPRTFLLDENMQIVAFNLRGDALMKKLEERLGSRRDP